ncbi:hypothetical protein [Streptomyces sp. JJ36]|uniref:hypothetical protein n=1 Tax=Streptomyces sp. JJ36 TaxID=2736645 RepID=UPI001F2DA1F5|nr:hypothetical protein [Streptomyces sp. JJ36]MCF6523782.1 hypothetical protein [Streptomyces sp. JJ36]
MTPADRPALGPDGQTWLVGECWLYCERQDVPVTWVGPAQWLGQHAPVYACAPCLQRLTAKVRAYLLHKDAPAPA